MSQKSFSVEKGFCGGLAAVSETFPWLRSCCEAALTAEREALASLVRKLSGGVSAVPAEMFLWLQPSLVLPLLISKMPHPGTLWPPQHLQPPGKDSIGGQTKCAFSFCQCGRDPKRHIAPISLPPACFQLTEHSWFSLQPSEFRSFLSFPPSAECPVLISLCTAAPGNPAQAPHTCAPSGDETELGARAGLPRGPPCH